MKPDFQDMVDRSGGNISVRDAEILYMTALEIGAKDIMEIGSREGGSSMALGLVAKKTNGLLYCIDPVLSNLATKQAPPKFWHNITDYELNDHIEAIGAFSPWIDVSDYPYFVEGLDYLLLDGGGSKNQPHHTRWMLVDYHYWEPLVRTGGRIAFHDWTGKNGVGDQVQRAVSIILETDDLIEVTRHESIDRGIIVFEKRG